MQLYLLCSLLIASIAAASDSPNANTSPRIVISFYSIPKRILPNSLNTGFFFCSLPDAEKVERLMCRDAEKFNIHLLTLKALPKILVMAR